MGCCFAIVLANSIVLVRQSSKLLTQISLCVTFLGRFSSKVSKIASQLLHSLRKCDVMFKELMIGGLFERRAVCKECDSIYRFEECSQMRGRQLVVANCIFKQFTRRNASLMKQIVSSSGHHRFYLFKVFACEPQGKLTKVCWIFGTL